ncbi:hypothetical protein RJ640_000250 [Escallonia rubra]|uniref:F-box domain-containing protein n=1 Tax=Escallonia rubra TaxID=112253 RepID=A0AA88RL79_9ASTE|nr:hypothetical protein RJ640_000250 [Escallonia rubra]
MPKRSRAMHERSNSVGLMLQGANRKPFCYFHAVTSFTSMPNFPSEIIADVLSRLSVKSLICLRCVSHLWCALIDSPHFNKTHLNRSIQTNTNTTVVIGERGTLHSLDLDYLDQATPITFPFKYYDSFAFLATCNGLILVHCATCCTNFFSQPIRTLALFNSSTHRKIWARQVKDSVHTIGTKGFIREGDRVIVAFKAGTKEFLVVPKMEKCYTDVSVDVLEGCLCLLGGYGQCCTDVWVMTDYGVKESWTRLFTVGPPVVGAYHNLSSLAYSRCRNEVLLNFNDKKLIWYDLKRKSVRDVPVRGLPSICCAEVYVKSLVMIDGCGKVEVEKQQGQVRTEEKKNKQKKRGVKWARLEEHLNYPIRLVDA